MWYEHGVAIDDCRRQPIAAVRSDSSVRNIIFSVVVVLALRLSQNNVIPVWGFARALEVLIRFSPALEFCHGSQSRTSTTPGKRRHHL